MTTEDYKVDKSAWGAGEWQNEPDRVDFIAHGFACLALRRDRTGHWCGYVGVPQEHPAHGKDYEHVDVEVHGGLTYAAACDGLICHTPAPGMPDDVWWFGFDCAHAGDIAPGIDADLRDAGIGSMFRRQDEYRALPYVRRQIESLARQLRALAEDDRR